MANSVQGQIGNGDSLDNFKNSLSSIVDNINILIDDEKILVKTLEEAEAAFYEILMDDPVSMNNICTILNDNAVDKNSNGYISLLKIAEKVGISQNRNWKWEVQNNLSDGKDVNTNIDEIKVIDWEIAELEENQKTTWKFYKGIDKGKEANSKSKIDEAKEKISSIIGEIDNKIGGTDGSVNDGSKLGEYKKLLKNFQKIIENPIDGNVKILQKCIYDNLDDNGKNQFEIDNKYNKKTDKFDWKFWNSTLEWLIFVVNKIKNYLSNFDSNDNSVDKKKKDGGIVVDRHGVVGDEDIEDVKDPEDKDVYKKKPEVSVSSDPLKELDWNNYLVMEDSQTLAKNAWLDWATFYSTEVYNGDVPTQDESWPYAKAPGVESDAEAPSNIDYECYVKLSNKPGKLYKVKVDSNKNISPIADEFDLGFSDDNGKLLEKKVMFANNGSCINYLKNKLPKEVKDSCNIEWNRKVNRYIVRSYKGDKGALTIEPMTIAWKWISRDKDWNFNLSIDLAFIHLTNFIRTIWGSRLKNDHPGIRFEKSADNKSSDNENSATNSGADVEVVNFSTDGGSMLTVASASAVNGAPASSSKYKLKIKWLGWVNEFPSAFWLDGVSGECINKFEEYYKNKWWKDDWSKKKENMGYDLI